MNEPSPASSDPGLTPDRQHDDLSSVTVAIVGCGNMGSAAAHAFRRSGIDPKRLLIVNSSAESSARAAEECGGTAAERHHAIVHADVVVLGVKPYAVLDVIREITPQLPPATVVVSLAAGVTISQMREVLSAGQPLVRAMPNTPIRVGEGVVGLVFGPDASDADRSLVHALFAGAGTVEEITEAQVHALIGAAGSLAGLTFSMIEAMTDEAVRSGLRRDVADRVVQQTVRGAASMLMATGEHPAVAKNQVSSPGGTTVEGLAVLERAGVRAGIAEAMRATVERSRELSGE